MPSRCFYVSGTGGERVSLDGPETYVGTAAALRGDAWSYSLGARGLSGATRAAREVSVTAQMTDPAAADLLRRAADRDVAMGTPGSIEVDGEWSQRAYVTGIEPQEIFGGYVSATLTVALLDGEWRRPVTREFRPVSDDPANEWLDLPADAPLDLLPARGASFVDSGSWLASPVLITVWGPAVSPSLTIGGNEYSFDISVPAGARLEVDGASWPRTITLVSATGDRTDAFACGERGGGAGSGSYCFEPVPAGRSEVSWEGGFGFDVTWYQVAGSPPLSGGDAT